MVSPITEHPFAPFIRILGKGKTGSRALSQAEAHDAFAQILRGAVEPEQIGAFLMLLRVKEETGEELAGFVTACRDSFPAIPQDLTADLDWSSYAGKRHQHPWFILAILLLCDAGYRTFIHGAAGHTSGRLYTEDALRALNLPVATSWNDVSAQLSQQGLSYMPLSELCEPLNELIKLRSLLGLRSPVHTLTRMLNPLRAPASIQSIFHPAYGELHQQADRLLGQPRALVFKGESGEVEVKPHADTRLVLLNECEGVDYLLPRTIDGRVEPVMAPSVEPVRALWRGEIEGGYGVQATLATTTAALLVLDFGTLDTCQQRANELWAARDRTRLAPCR